MALRKVPDRVYVAMIEVKPLTGSELNPSEYAGAAVRVYLPAPDFLSAQEMLFASLQENYFELTEIEFMADEAVGWENPNDPDGEAAIAEARKTKDVVYSEFNAWGPDDEVRH